MSLIAGVSWLLGVVDTAVMECSLTCPFRDPSHPVWTLQGGAEGR